MISVVEHPSEFWTSLSNRSIAREYEPHDYTFVGQPISSPHFINNVNQTLVAVDESSKMRI